MKSYLFVVLLLAPFLGNAAVIERIVAVVNSEIILESDFKQLKEKMKNATLIDDSLIFDGNIASLKNSKKNQLDYLINEKILDSEVKRLNLSVTMERVNDEIKEMAKRNNLSSEELLKAVRNEGIPTSEYQAFLKTKLERQSLIESEIISKLRITDEEAMVEYGRIHKDVKQTLNEFSLAHIFFNPKKGGVEAAQKRAQKVLEKLSSGGTFETVAEQSSEDSNFSNGGYLGSFKSGEFNKEIEAAVMNLKPNEISGIVKTKQGVHIIKVLSKSVTTDPKFEKEKAALKAQLMEANFRRQLKIWLQTKREDSQIRINE